MFSEKNINNVVVWDIKLVNEHGQELSCNIGSS